MSEERYAIYFVPGARTALYRFGASVIGYDCFEGTDVPQLAGLGDSEADWHALTEEPRKYGFHATLRAPFRLQADTDEQGLIETFERFARARGAVPEFMPKLRILGGFIAIMPRDDCPPLFALADDCVTSFDKFRAPLSAQERARRLAARLSREEVANLERWGYPYVFGHFRFHMTLTGLLPGERRSAILSQLEERFARAHRHDRPVTVDRLALVRQAGAAARFVVVREAQVGTSA
jgi:putative phosphonate metabolism protein